jgi:hypothetical protein
MAAGSDRKEGREKKGGGNRKRSEINQRDDPAYIYRRSCATHTADKTEKDLLLLLVIWTNTGWKGHRQYVAILIDVGSSKSFGCIRSYISGCMGMMMGECARLSLSLMYYPDIVVKTSPLSLYTHTHTHNTPSCNIQTRVYIESTMTIIDTQSANNNVCPFI